VTVINYESGKSSGVIYVQTQGANAYQTPVELPIAAHGVQVLDFEWKLDKGQKARNAQTGNMDGAPGSIQLMRKGTFRVLMEALPSGSIGVEMDPHILFLTGIWNHSVGTSTATTVSGAGSTASIVDVTDASGIAVGQFVGFTDSSGNVHGRRVTAVDVASTPDNVTLETPLTFTPADTTAVHAAKTYTLLSDNHETAATIWHKLDHGGVRLGGCVGDTFRWIYGNNDTPQIEVSGFFREFAQGRPTTLDGGINNSVTTMTVDDWRGITKGMCYTIEAEGANAAEVVYVDADPTSTAISIERNKDAGGADAHGDAAVVTVYEPTPTLAESTLSAEGAQIYVSLTSGAVSQLESESGSIEVTGGIKPRERGHGDPWAIHGYAKSGDLMVKTNLSTFAEKATWEYYQHNKDADERPATMQWGDTAYSVLCVAMARQVFDQSDVTPGDAHVVATLTSESRGHRSNVPAVAFGSM
jgi:hypothetical protein